MQNKIFKLIRFFASNHRLWLLLCLQFCVSASPLVENINNFEDFAIKQVNALAQDQEGFLWIATPNGLFRYDGDSVKRFAHQVDDADSLTDNWVVDVVADNQGYLWIISRGQGLSRFDTAQETFVHFSHVPGDSTTLDSNDLNSVALTPDNQLWIGSKHGLNLFNIKTLSNRRFDPGMRFGNDRRALAGAIGPSYWATSTAYAFYVLLGSLSFLFYYLRRVRVYSHNRTIEGQGEDKASTPQKPSLKKATIMVVVDNGEMREQLAACLDDVFVCIMTDNTADIITQTREQRPDLVICDVMIEQISGAEITIMLKRNPDTCSIPTLLLTHSTSQNYRLNRSQPRVDACIENPFNAAELILRIGHLLSNRNLLARRYQKIIMQPSKANTNVILAPNSIKGQPVDVAVFEKMKAGQLKRKFTVLLDKVLETNYHDCHFDVTRFAGGMLTSKRQLNRKMHTMVDMSPAKAIRNFRLNKAADQLIKGESPSCVCYEVGFTSHSYFSSCFKAKYHCLPCNYMVIVLAAAQNDEKQS